MKQDMTRWGVRFTGIVQGVGFRPFVSVVAHELQLDGFVYNDTQGVYVEIEGPVDVLHQWLCRIQQECPPLARIENMVVKELPISSVETDDEIQEHKFIIAPSPLHGLANTFISADTAPCDDCLDELENPKDPRYGYSFINCTNCGPRYTIIESVPYDRKRTTMKDFTMCDDCYADYTNLNGRRYHAEPTACGDCGPCYTLLDSSGRTIRLDADEDTPSARENRIFHMVRQRVAEGAIIAMKGIGGYHLLCDATNHEAVKRLRQRKGRPHKPLAMMAGSLERIEQIAYVSDEEKRLLLSPVHPIVLLASREPSGKGTSCTNPVAPHNHYWGIMLPYAPVHHLLLPKDALWVMTSGNKSGDPVLFKDEQALSELQGIADYFLVHNRSICAPVDDSVMAVVEGKQLIYRRSRGFVPEPIYIEGMEPSTHQQSPLPTIVAMGGDMKNAFAINRDHHVLLGPHIGDLAHESTHSTLEWTLAHYQELFDLVPQAIVVDAHPGYYSTRLGTDYGETYHIPLLTVQHHHAHVAAVISEYNLQGTTLGICYDGTGYGTDGSLWGGEFLLCHGTEMKRVAHTAYVPLPGGERAVSEPWRQALWYLRHTYGDTFPPLYESWLTTLPKGWELLDQALQKGMPFCKSCGVGRLFDAVGTLLGVGNVHTFDGQIAMALEQLAYGEKGKLLDYHYDGHILDTTPLVADIIESYVAGMSKYQLAASFHRTLAYATSEIALDISERYHVDHIVLSGGVFQNRRLLQELTKAWRLDPFYISQRVPCNDGGIALGQWWLAQQMMQSLCEDGTCYIENIQK